MDRNCCLIVFFLVFGLLVTTSTAVDIIEYVNVAHSIGSESETLFKITGTCGQDPMVPLIAHPSLFAHPRPRISN
jgi:hypothetical protein